MKAESCVNVERQADMERPTDMPHRPWWAHLVVIEYPRPPADIIMTVPPSHITLTVHIIGETIYLHTQTYYCGQYVYVKKKYFYITCNEDNCISIP